MDDKTDELTGISIHAPREGGDTAIQAIVYYQKISIHAPREGGDDGVIVGCDCCIISIHAPREGGDFFALCKPSRTSNFNPRPPRGGRPCCRSAVWRPVSISIHAPREGGDVVGVGVILLGLDISIHAPREGGDV